MEEEVYADVLNIAGEVPDA